MHPIKELIIRGIVVLLFSCSLVCFRSFLIFSRKIIFLILSSKYHFLKFKYTAILLINDF